MRLTRKGLGVQRKYYRTKSRKQRARQTGGQTGGGPTGGQTGGGLQDEAAIWIATLLRDGNRSAYYESYNPKEPFPTADIDENDRELLDAAVTISKEWFPEVRNGAEFSVALTQLSINEIALKFIVSTENALRLSAGKLPITSLNTIQDYPLFIWALMASAPDREVLPSLTLSPQPSAQG